MTFCPARGANLESAMALVPITLVRSKPPHRDREDLERWCIVANARRGAEVRDLVGHWFGYQLAANVPRFPAVPVSPASGAPVPRVHPD